MRWARGGSVVCWEGKKEIDKPRLHVHKLKSCICSNWGSRWIDNNKSTSCDLHCFLNGCYRRPKMTWHDMTWHGSRTRIEISWDLDSSFFFLQYIYITTLTNIMLLSKVYRWIPRIFPLSRHTNDFRASKYSLFKCSERAEYENLTS